MGKTKKTKKTKKPTPPTHVYYCDHCPGLRCVHSIYGKRKKDEKEYNRKEHRKCIYRKLVEKYEV